MKIMQMKHRSMKPGWLPMEDVLEWGLLLIRDLLT